MIFAADYDARPGELVALKHRNVEAGKVRLPGTNTRNAQRIVHLTARGIAAYESFPRSISTPLVWHNHGRPLDWNHWRADVWHPALTLAELEARSAY